jgi:hypothetical protein
VTTGTPEARPAARQPQAAITVQAPRRLRLVLAVIATAQLMIILDLTIVTVALPHIQAALGFSGSNLEWVRPGLQGRRPGAGAGPAAPQAPAPHREQVEPGYQDWLSEVLPRACVMVWPGSGHFPQLAHPRRFAGCLAATAQWAGAYRSFAADLRLLGQRHTTRREP